MGSTRRPRRISSSATTRAEPQNRRADKSLDKGVARYYRLYELLSAALQDGTIAPESALPSEPELCARHGISRTTVRRALDRLEREERIVRRRGSGTYARPLRTRPRLCVELHALPETLVALESHAATTVVRFAAAPVPRELRAIAGEIGSTAYVLERLLSSQGHRLSLTAAYLPEPVGRRLQRSFRSRASLIAILARSGQPVTAVRCCVGAVAADTDVARTLRVPLGSPLLRVRAVLTGEGGEMRAVTQTLCRSDRLQLKVLEPQR